MPMSADFKKTKANFIKEYGKDKGTKMYFAYVKKNKLDDTKSHPKKKEALYIQGLTFKEEGKDFYVEGFISTADPDNNHLIGQTPDFPEMIKDQQDLVNQLNSNPQAGLLSLHHDWIKGEGTRPIGVIVDQAVLKIHPDTQKPGAYVKYKLNSAHKEFENTKSEVQDKILTGFSIELDSSVESHIQDVNGKPTRVFETVPLFGVGLASRGVHPDATIESWGTKEYLEYYDKNKEAIEMQTKEEIQTETEAKEKKEAEVKAKEEAEAKVKEEKEAAEKAALEGKEEKIEIKSNDPDYINYLKFKEMEATKKTQDEFNLRIKESISSGALKLERPLLNTKEGADAALQTKEGIAFKESHKRYQDVVSSNAPIGLQWKAAGEFVNAEIDMAAKQGIPNIRERSWGAQSIQEKIIQGTAPPVQIDYNMTGYVNVKEGTFDNWGSPKMKQEAQGAYANKIGLKESLAYKTLETDTNVADASWSYTNYYMSPVELNDIFQPVIVNQLNDETNVWNTLQKEDFSKYSSIQFRARSARNTTAAGYAENKDFYGDNSYTGRTGRIKLMQRFAYYYVLVQVTGPEIALTETPGGIGDIYADEVKWATADLIRILEKAIVGTGDGTSESTALGFEGLMKTSGNLYGRNVASSGPPDYTKLQVFEKTDMSDARITLEKMRLMVDGVVDNGAKERDLVFYCRRKQQTFIKSLIQNIQRIVPTSARVGFIGKPEIDGIPVFDAVNLNADDLFLVDTAHTKIGLKVAPTYEETAKTHDARNGYIKIYFNLYSDAPNHNAWIYNLAES